MKKKIIIFVVFCLGLAFLPCLNAADVVFTEEQTEDGLIYLENLEFTTGEKEFYINDIYFGNNFYIGVGYVIKDDGGQEYLGYPYLIYYENGILTFTKMIENYGFGEFEKVCFYEGHFYVSGTAETDGIIKPIIIKVDNKGNIQKMLCLYCDEDTSSINMYVDHEEVFLFITSQAERINDYKLEKAVNKFCLVKLNLDLQIKWLDCYGNNGVNSIYDIKYYNDYFYIYSKVSGDGDFYFKTEEMIIIYGVSVQGDIAFEYYVEDAVIGNSKLFIVDGEIILYNKKYYGNEIEIYKASGSYMKKKDIMEAELLEKDSEIKETLFVNVEGEIFIVTHYICEGVNYLRFRGENDQYEFIIDDDKDITNINITDVYYQNGFIYFKYQSMIKNVYYPYYKRLICIKKDNSELYFNNNKVVGVINDNLNPIFGRYNGIVCYQYQDVTILVNGYVDIPLKSMVINKGVYDVGLKLEANGEMYLNNSLIPQGYNILDEGDYLLEIRGENDVRYLMFSVKKLSSNEDVKEIESIECSSICYSNAECVENVSFASNQGELAEKSLNMFLLIGLVLVSGFLVGFFIPLFICRRKMND